MTDFVSEVKSISAPQKAVYDVLSDWSQLEKVKDRIPAGKISDFSFNADSCRFKVNMAGVGEIAMRIIERDPCKTIKIASEQSPISFTAWLQLKEKDLADSYLKITLRADIPFMLKGMLSGPLQNGVDTLAETIATFSYNL